MANTYTIIASNTLASPASSVSFSGIPNGYMDLVLKCSIRQDDTGAFNPTTIYYNVNNNSSSLWSNTYLRNLSGTVTAGPNSGTNINNGVANSSWSSATSNTFANTELYIPSYAVSQNKPSALFEVVENNAGSNYMIKVQANLFRSTNAITSVQIIAYPGQQFVANSSFFLYGIKNS